MIFFEERCDFFPPFFLNRLEKEKEDAYLKG